MNKIIMGTVIIGVMGLMNVSADGITNERASSMKTNATMAMFGTGCFWCSESVFQRLPGVISVKSGYSGGTTKDPTYNQVCTGDTGHAEVVQVTYDAQVVSYDQLLDTFWVSHDPTTLNRQGVDVGTQYRSVILYYNEDQHDLAESSKQKLDKFGNLKAPVVTQIVPAGVFYPAEDYHDDYFNRNKSAPYCRFVIAPKLKKLEQKNALKKDMQRKAAVGIRGE